MTKKKVAPRAGMGRPRRQPLASSESVWMTFTPLEYAKLAASCPPDAELAVWARDQLLAHVRRLPKKKAGA